MAIDPFTMALFALKGYSIIQGLKGASADQRASELNAFNTETDAERSKIEARQRHNDRLDLYRSNVSSNFAAFSAMERDVPNDQSVKAFFKKQKEVATTDTARSDFMGAAEAMKYRQQASTLRQEGRANMAAARLRAFSSAINLTSDYSNIKTTDYSNIKTP